MLHFYCSLHKAFNSSWENIFYFMYGRISDLQKKEENMKLYLIAYNVHGQWFFLNYLSSVCVALEKVY